MPDRSGGAFSGLSLRNVPRSTSRAHNLVVFRRRPIAPPQRRRAGRGRAFLRSKRGRVSCKYHGSKDASGLTGGLFSSARCGELASPHRRAPTSDQVVNSSRLRTLLSGAKSSHCHRTPAAHRGAPRLFRRSQADPVEFSAGVSGGRHQATHRSEHLACDRHQRPMRA